MYHQNYVMYFFTLISALGAFICNNTVCVLFIYFSLKATVGLKIIFSSPEQSSQRAIVLPPALALALALVSASTNVKVLR